MIIQEVFQDLCHDVVYKCFHFTQTFLKNKIELLERDKNICFTLNF